MGKFDILNLIASQSDILIGFGGHKGAAGLVIEPANLQEFKRRVNATKVNIENFRYVDDLLGELNLAEFDLEMLKILKFFEPYGQKNPRPVFCIKNALVKDVKLIGREQKHLKMVLEKDGVFVDGLFFNFDYEPQIGELINAKIGITKNNFKGVITPELIIHEIER